MMITNSIIMTREQLYNEIWKISLTGVAKKYNLHYAKFINSCKDYNIPTPTPAYWTKKHMGMDVNNDIIPLPKSKVENITLYLKANKGVLIEKTEEQKIEDVFYNSFNILDFLEESERKNVAKVISELDINKHKQLHKKLIGYKKKLEEKRKSEINNSRYYSSSYSNYGELNYFDNISKIEKERFIKILTCIYHAIEELGGKINDDLSMRIRNEEVSMDIFELQDRVDHELTKDEALKLIQYEEDKRKNHYVWKPNIRKYDYCYNGKLKIVFESRNSIKDNEKFKLEDKLDSILIQLYEKSEKVRIARVERESLEKKEEDERKRKVMLNNRRKEEALKVIELVNKAEDYRIAGEIRKYIDAIATKDVLDEETKEWIKWAKEKADWFDPTTAINDELLGKRKHEESKDSKNQELNRYGSYYSWG